MSPGKSWVFVKVVTSHKEKCELLQIYLIFQPLHPYSQQFEEILFPTQGALTWSWALIKEKESSVVESTSKLDLILICKEILQLNLKYKIIRKMVQRSNEYVKDSLKNHLTKTPTSYSLNLNPYYQKCLTDHLDFKHLSAHHSKQATWLWKVYHFKY